MGKVNLGAQRETRTFVLIPDAFPARVLANVEAMQHDAKAFRQRRFDRLNTAVLWHRDAHDKVTVLVRCCRLEDFEMDFDLSTAPKRWRAVDD